MKDHKDNSWRAWGQKKDRFKRTGSTIKAKALNEVITRNNKSHISGNTYSNG